MSIRILGTGSYLPEKVMTNEDFEKIIDTSDEWITKRTGIKRRHYVENGMWNKDMCVIAANIAMKEAGITKDDLGGIIVASVTNEMGVPSVASQIQRELEIPVAICFDVNSACTGFMFALKAAEGFLKPGGKPFAGKSAPRDDRPARAAKPAPAASPRHCRGMEVPRESGGNPRARGRVPGGEDCR